MMSMPRRYAVLALVTVAIVSLSDSVPSRTLSDEASVQRSVRSAQLQQQTSVPEQLPVSTTTMGVRDGGTCSLKFGENIFRAIIM